MIQNHLRNVFRSTIQSFHNNSLHIFQFSGNFSLQTIPHPITFQDILTTCPSGANSYTVQSSMEIILGVRKAYHIPQSQINLAFGFHSPYIYFRTNCNLPLGLGRLYPTEFLGVVEIICVCLCDNSKHSQLLTVKCGNSGLAMCLSAEHLYSMYEPWAPSPALRRRKELYERWLVPLRS